MRVRLNISVYSFIKNKLDRCSKGNNFLPPVFSSLKFQSSFNPTLVNGVRPFEIQFSTHKNIWRYEKVRRSFPPNPPNFSTIQRGHRSHGLESKRHTAPTQAPLVCQIIKEIFSRRRGRSEQEGVCYLGVNTPRAAPPEGIRGKTSSK